MGAAITFLGTLIHVAMLDVWGGWGGEAITFLGTRVHVAMLDVWGGWGKNVKQVDSVKFSKLIS